MLGKNALLVALAAVSISAAAQGALTINESQVVDGKYTYTLAYSTYQTQFASDVYQNNNTDLYIGGSTYVRRANPATGVYVGTYSFTYKFDFSDVGPGYEITSVNTKEVLNTGVDTAGSSITVKYSTDGTNFITRFKLDAGASDKFIDTSMLGSFPTEWHSYGASDLNNTSAFYYRVEYDVPSTTSTAYGSRSVLRWGTKTASSSNAPFEAAFTLQAVPEPTSLALAGLIGAGLLSRRRRTA